MKRRAFCFVVLVACKPDFGDRDSLVTDPRILAIAAEPAEARPDEAIAYSALVVTDEGRASSPPAAWAFCTSPRLLTENGATSAACLSDGATPIPGSGLQIFTAMPAGACSLFGPETISAEIRPRDPDVTGGYHQPVRLTVATKGEPLVGVLLHRVRCKLAGAGADVSAEFDRRYVANRNPSLLPLEIEIAGAPASRDAIARGATLRFRVRWPSEAAERYAAFDVLSQTVRDRREALRVSWAATRGSFVSDRTGRSEDDAETFTENDWTAPSEPGVVHLFVVLRDSRGGVTWATEDLVIR
jgi:hypothetical protein